MAEELVEQVAALLKEVVEVVLPVFERRVSRMVSDTDDAITVDLEWSRLETADALVQIAALEPLTIEGGAPVLADVEELVRSVAEGRKEAAAAALEVITIKPLGSEGKISETVVAYDLGQASLTYSLAVHLGIDACATQRQFGVVAEAMRTGRSTMVGRNTQEVADEVEEEEKEMEVEKKAEEEAPLPPLPAAAKQPVAHSAPPARASAPQPAGKTSERTPLMASATPVAQVESQDSGCCCTVM